MAITKYQCVDLWVGILFVFLAEIPVIFWTNSTSSNTKKMEKKISFESMVHIKLENLLR